MDSRMAFFAASINGNGNIIMQSITHRLEDDALEFPSGTLITLCLITQRYRSWRHEGFTFFTSQLMMPLGYIRREPYREDSRSAPMSLPLHGKSLRRFFPSTAGASAGVAAFSRVLRNKMITSWLPPVILNSYGGYHLCRQYKRRRLRVRKASVLVWTISRVPPRSILTREQSWNFW